MDKIIGVCSFIATGSSCVSDFLREFDENITYDKDELSFIHVPGGIEDLAYHLNEGSAKIAAANAAIHRFKRICALYMRRMQQMTRGQFKSLTNAYLKKIIQSSWYGCAHADYMLYACLEKSVFIRQAVKLLQKSLAVLETAFQRQINGFPFRQFYFSANQEDFYAITAEYIDTILRAAGKTEGYNFVLDQPFSGNDPQRGMRFFNNPRAIIVDRDPRDLYLHTQYYLLPIAQKLLPADAVNFAALYRNMRKGMPYLKPDPCILRIQFEDMIYEYQKTTSEIINFLELKEHNRPMSIFKPEVSIVNTQLYKDFPKYEQDIAYIEKELPEYLYPFEKYEGIKTKAGKIF